MLQENWIQLNSKIPVADLPYGQVTALDIITEPEWRVYTFGEVVFIINHRMSATNYDRIPGENKYQKAKWIQRQWIEIG